jgi:hypothetical protein
MGKRSAVVELFLGDMGSMQRELRPSTQREDKGSGPAARARGDREPPASPNHRRMDRRSEGVPPIARLLDIRRRRQRSLKRREPALRLE